LSLRFSLTLLVLSTSGFPYYNLTLHLPTSRVYPYSPPEDAPSSSMNLSPASLYQDPVN
jgi:hypothetical protein